MMEKLLGKKWFSRDNLLLLVLLGVLLFVIALPVKKEDSGKGQEKENAAAMLEELTASTQTVTAGSTEEYAAYLEEKLKKMLEAVRGLGEVEVMVTLESSEEKIVEKDMTAERSNTEEQDAAGGARTVNTSNTEYRTIYREDTGGDPFVVKTITPKVEGVLVVAEGAGKGNMAGEITQIIQALFGVEAHRIKVEKEYLAADDADTLSAVDSTDIVTDMESLDSDMDIVMEDYLEEDMQVAEATPEEGEIPGEAVLTGTSGVEVLSAARLSKEQTRARNKETLLEIINSTELSDAQKQEAVDSMVRMTDIAEKEAAAEVLLQAKGFQEAVVSINGDAVDVVINAAELSDAQRAQIEDIVKRKTDIAAENIVISTIVQ